MQNLLPDDIEQIISISKASSMDFLILLHSAVLRMKNEADGQALLNSIVIEPVRNGATRLSSYQIIPTHVNIHIALFNQDNPLRQVQNALLEEAWLTDENNQYNQAIDEEVLNQFDARRIVIAQPQSIYNITFKNVIATSNDTELNKTPNDMGAFYFALATSDYNLYCDVYQNEDESGLIVENLILHHMHELEMWEIRTGNVLMTMRKANLLADEMVFLNIMKSKEEDHSPDVVREVRNQDDI